MPTTTLVLLVAMLFQVSAPAPARVRSRTLAVADAGTVTYGLYVPGDYTAGRPRPLILALHPGGERTANYGSRFMQQVVLPALTDLGAVVVAPDCPVQAKSWADPMADRSVMAVLDKVRQEYEIDSRRVLVTGFSMGGRGTWFMSSQHPDFFTGAIAMAASTGDLPQDRLARIPTYVIHSRDDRVVSFDQAEQNARQLEGLGRSIKFEEVRGPGHFDMGGYIEPLRRAGRWITAAWAK
jgi:predicted peptidase